MGFACFCRKSMLCATEAALRAFFHVFMRSNSLKFHKNAPLPGGCEGGREGDRSPPEGGILRRVLRAGRRRRIFARPFRRFLAAKIMGGPIRRFRHSPENIGSGVSRGRAAGVRCGVECGNLRSVRLPGRARSGGSVRRAPQWRPRPCAVEASRPRRAGEKPKINLHLPEKCGGFGRL